MKKILPILLCLFTANVFAQNVGIGTLTPDASAQLEIYSLSKGLLIPRMTQSRRDLINLPANSLLIYQTDVIPGLYINKGIPASPDWQLIASGLNVWNLTGNAGTVDGTSFIGTTDNIPFNIRVNNQKAGRIDPLLDNAFYGLLAGNTNNTGFANTANGSNALLNNTNGNSNTANGFGTLNDNTIGSNNTALGYQSLFSNVAGNKATAIGKGAMFYSNNSPGAFDNYNVALGFEALRGSTNAAANTGNNNTAIGYLTLWSNSIGSFNTANGSFALGANIDGNFNTANGYFALVNNTSGTGNTSNGVYSLFNNSTGNGNTAIGNSTLFSNIAGKNATAIGNGAMFYAYSGTSPFENYNVAVGFEALKGSGNSSLNTGNYNTALGYQTLPGNSTGNFNTANGYFALHSNNSGQENTATGVQTLYTNTTGGHNTATGTNALYTNLAGSDNTANGWDALFNNAGGIQNTALGSNALTVNTTGNYNTAVGYNTGPNANNLSNTTCIGIDATATASNTISVGNTFITSIKGQVNFTVYSDGRFKENIKENVPGLAFITQLRPVTYTFNHQKLIDFTGIKASFTQKPTATITTGFIAQEVEASAKKLGFDFSGVDKPKNDKDFYGLRYAEFVVPLVKGMQEQQLMIENQQKRIEELEKLVKQLVEKK